MSAGPMRIALVALALLLPLFSPNDFTVHLAVLVCLNTVIVSGLSLLSRTGQLSFCHAAFIGMGAYAAVLAGMRLGWPFAIAVVVGALASALLAFLLGAVILRLRGVYFVLITFAFAELFRLALLEGAAWTGGANGIANVSPATLFGIAFDTKRSFYVLAASLAALSMLLLHQLFRTARGQALDAVGENPQLAEGSGLSVRRHQMFAFVLGAGFAGVGGAFLAHYVGYISPESFALHASLSAIIMLVVGGRFSIYGPFIGALVMTPLPELFRGAVQSQNIFYGITLILILRFLPQGLASLPAVLRRRRRGAA